MILSKNGITFLRLALPFLQDKLCSYLLDYKKNIRFDFDGELKTRKRQIR